MSGSAGSTEGIRWYGRRRGHALRKGRRALLATLLPRLALTPPAAGALDLAAAFGEGRPVFLEIGFGAGEHLAAQAERQPEIGFIGCEPFVNGIASLLAHVERLGLTNVRIFADDVRRLLPALEEASIARVYALFPDPWPKKRHHKRRLISAATLDALARVMADGAELRFASDHLGYVDWTLAHAGRHAAFECLAAGPEDWRRPPADWLETRYERKARDEGASPLYLRFRRRRR